MRQLVRGVWTGGQVTDEMRLAAKKAIEEIAEDILGRSNEIVPKDEGTLMRSGDTDIEVDSSKVQASVYYDTPYAARLHEHPEYNFQNGREGKYLENTIKRNTERYKQWLQTALKGALNFRR